MSAGKKLEGRKEQFGLEFAKQKYGSGKVDKSRQKRNLKGGERISDSATLT